MVDQEPILGAASNAYYGASMFIILTLGLVGNVITLFILMHPQHRRKSLSPLMINLCVADLLVCLFGYTVSVNYNMVDFANAGGSPPRCYWLAFINSQTGLTSIGTLAAMGFISYMGITRIEIADQNRMSLKTEMIILVGTWIYGFILTIPPAFGWNHYIPIPARVSCHPDWYSQDTVDQSYIIFMMLFGFFIPLLIMVFSYSRIYGYVRNTSYEASAEATDRARQLHSRKKTLRIIVAMTVAFFISWSPYTIVSLSGTITGKHNVPPSAELIPELMAKASVVYNPILYVLLNSKFRATLMRMCSGYWNQVGNSTENTTEIS